MSEFLRELSKTVGLTMVFAFFLSEPVPFSGEQLQFLAQGRSLRSKEERISFTTRDLNEFTHRSPLRRALDLNHPLHAEREELPKARKRKSRSARRQQAKKFDSSQRLARRIRMKRGERPSVSGVQGLQKF